MTATSTPLFNYNTLNVWLEAETKSLHVQLNRPAQKNALNTEMIFELESVFSWLTGHLEVNAVHLSGAGETFSQGFDLQEFKHLNEDKIRRNLSKLQRLVYSFYHLPQTIICSLQGEVTGAGIELALGADIRLVSEGTSLWFNHLQEGLVPTCGGIGFLSLSVSRSLARQWVLANSPVESAQLIQSGFALPAKDADQPRQTLRSIAKQAPVARIQAKRSFLESILPELDRALNFERSIGWAAFGTRDWQAAANAKQNETPAFMPARDFGGQVRQQQKSAPLEN